MDKPSEAGAAAVGDVDVDLVAQTVHISQACHAAAKVFEDAGWNVDALQLNLVIRLPGTEPRFALGSSNPVDTDPDAIAFLIESVRETLTELDEG